MKRLFTFGCSFTQYWRWPTWADYVGRVFEHYENWGLCGAGNSYIFNSLIECHQRNTLAPGDLVLIMWTNTSREDRYVGNRWLEGGNVYWGSELGTDYVRRFACERGYLIRDLAVMAACEQLLQHWGCDWRWFSMVPFDRTNSDNELGENPNMPTQADQDVRDLYRSVIDRMQPSVLDTVFGGSWFTGDGIPDSHDGGRRDFHPTPLEHVRYIDLVAPDLANADHAAWMARWDQELRSGANHWCQPNRPAVRL
jgi:hypothetical protein